MENRGQLGNDDIAFYGSAEDLGIGFGVGQVAYRIPNRGPGPGAVIRVVFEGANAVAPEPLGPPVYRANFFRGSDPASWVRNAPAFAGIVYRGLYRGIDLVYHAGTGPMKSEFVVGPGADPSAIRFRYEGATAVHVRRGELVIDSPAGPIVDSGLRAYQDAAEVACEFRVHGTVQSFDLGAWDPTVPLIIDPFLYGTFLAGTSADAGRAIAVDASGAAYVVGQTLSPEFPTTPGAFDTSLADSFDAFVAKLSPGGDALVYATFLGGAGEDFASAVSVDGAGNVFVTGYTLSADFPATPGAFNTTFHGPTGGVADVFVAKLSASGDQLLYSTLLGTDGEDRAVGLAVDGSGNAFVTGTFFTANFPVTPGAFSTSFAPSGNSHGFVTGFNPIGSALVYSTYLGGLDEDVPTAIGLDPNGDAIVAGWTRSPDFPTTAGAFSVQPDHNAPHGFITKFNADGTALVFSTFLSGQNADHVNALFVDPAGAVYLTGDTASPDFPTTPGAFNTTLPAYNTNAFVTKLAAAGNALVYSTFLGGYDFESGYAIAADGAGEVFLTGETWSYEFPTTPHAIDQSQNEPCICSAGDAFLSKFNASGSSLLSSTFLGGVDNDAGYGIAVSGDGTAYLTGATTWWFSGNHFPTTPGSFAPQPAGFNEVFVAAIDLNAPPEAEVHGNLTVFANTVSVLDGTYSFDPDGDVLAYLWEQTSGPPMSFSGILTERLAMTPSLAGSYTFVLTVTDPYFASGSDTVVVNVTGSPGGNPGGSGLGATIWLASGALLVVAVAVFALALRRRQSGGNRPS